MKRLILAFSLVLCSFVLASTAWAADCSTGGGTTLCNPLGAGTDLETLLADILSFVVEIGAVVVVLMLVYVGYLFVTGANNETKRTQARQALLWTVVGALILLGAEAIALAIQETVDAIGG